MHNFHARFLESLFKTQTTELLLKSFCFDLKHESPQDQPANSDTLVNRLHSCQYIETDHNSANAIAAAVKTSMDHAAYRYGTDDLF